MKNIFIFDFDGVITHPHIKKPNEAIISFIANQLNNQKPVALATGRAMAWIQTHVLPLIQERIDKKENLDTLFVSGEKGGVWIEFVQGAIRPSIDTKIDFPRVVAKKVYSYTQGKPEVFFDRDKYTMVSVEIAGGEDPVMIKKQKKVLEKITESIRKDILPQFPQIVSDPSEISIDLLVKGIDKRIAVNRFLEFLDRKHIAAESFIMLGDSPSDVLVPEELQVHGKQVTFMYVGKEPLEKQFSFPVITSENNYYDKAVVELLEKYK